MDKNFKILLLILLLGTTFRAWNLETIPHWYWDEGVNMNIAWNLTNGKMQWFCLQYAFVPHPPLFFIIAGVLLKFLGNYLIVLRTLSVTYSLLSILVLYLIGKEMFDEKTGLLAGFLFAIYPTAIYWNRLGFANNQLMLLLLLTLYFFIRYLDEKKDRWLYLVSLSLGLALITEILGFCIFISIAILFWFYCKKKTLNVLILSSIPFLLFTGVMLWIMPDAFIHDILHNSGRINFSGMLLFIMLMIVTLYLPRAIRKTDKFCKPIIHEIGENLPVYYIAGSIVTFFIIYSPEGFLSLSDDFLMRGIDYLWLGVLGLFLVKEKINRDILIYSFLPLFSVIFIFDRTDHMLIPIHTFLCLGMAILLIRIFTLSINYFRKRLTSIKPMGVAIITLILIFYPVAFFIYYDFGAFLNRNWLMSEDITRREMVADLIKANVNSSDLVIVDSHLVRFVDCRASVLIQALAHDGVSVAYMAHDYEQERFLFNCSHKNARFIVVKIDTFEKLKNKTENKTELATIIDEIQNCSVYNIDPYLSYMPQMESG